MDKVYWEKAIDHPSPYLCRQEENTTLLVLYCIYAEGGVFRTGYFKEKHVLSFSFINGDTRTLKQRHFWLGIFRTN